MIELNPAEREVTLDRLARKVGADGYTTHCLSSVVISLPAQFQAEQSGGYLSGNWLKQRIKSSLEDQRFDNFQLVSNPKVYVRHVRERSDNNRVVLEAENFLKKRLEKKYLEVQLKLVGRRSASALANTKLRARLVKEDAIRRVCVWVDEFVNEQVRNSYPVWFEVSAKRPVFRLSRAVKSGELINADDLIEDTIDVAAMRGAPIWSPDGYAGYVFLKDYEAGQVVFETSLQRKPAVAFGDTVGVVSIAGNVRIATKAIARSDAEVGEKVSLVSLSSNEIYFGEVVGDSAVLVGKIGGGISSARGVK